MIAEKFKNFIEKSADHYVNDKGKFLKITYAATLAVSCIGQATVIWLNDNIPSNQKKFLIPQELADGVLNVSIYMLLTSKLGKLGESLVNKGIINPANNVEKALFTKNFGNLTAIIGSIIATNILTPILRNKVSSIVQKKLIKPATPHQVVNSEIFNMVSTPRKKEMTNMTSFLSSCKTSSIGRMRI